MRAQGSRDIVTPSCAHPSSEATEILEGLLPLCFWPLERVKIPARKLHLGHPLFPRIPPSSMFEETRRTPANYPRLITLPPCQFVAKIPIPEESYIERRRELVLIFIIFVDLMKREKYSGLMTLPVNSWLRFLYQRNLISRGAALIFIE